MFPVRAASGVASLESLGKLGTVNIGSKSESGTWLQTQVDSKPVFCMDLGKACHTGYTYKSESKTISSDDANTKNKLEAKIGYWYEAVIRPGFMHSVLFGALKRDTRVKAI